MSFQNLVGTLKMFRLIRNESVPVMGQVIWLFSTTMNERNTHLFGIVSYVVKEKLKYLKTSSTNTTNEAIRGFSFCLASKKWEQINQMRLFNWDEKVSMFAKLEKLFIFEINKKYLCLHGFLFSFTQRFF